MWDEDRKEKRGDEGEDEVVAGFKIATDDDDDDIYKDAGDLSRKKTSHKKKSSSPSHPSSSSPLNQLDDPDDNIERTLREKALKQQLLKKMKNDD